MTSGVQHHPFETLNEAIDNVKKLARKYKDTKYQHVMFDIDDTLYKSSNRKFGQVVDLLKWFYRHGFKNHIVTARQDTPKQRSEVFKILQDLDIMPYIETIYLAPSASRKTDTGISKFKASTRRKIAKDFGGSFFLAVGDRLTDVCEFKRDSAVEEHEDMALASAPYEIVKCPRSSSLFGLKLEKMH